MLGCSLDAASVGGNAAEVGTASGRLLSEPSPPAFLWAAIDPAGSTPGDALTRFFGAGFVGSPPGEGGSVEAASEVASPELVEFQSAASSDGTKALLACRIGSACVLAMVLLDLI